MSRVKRILTIIDRVSRAGNSNIGFPDGQLVTKQMRGPCFSIRWLVRERKNSQADAAISEKSQYGRARRDGHLCSTATDVITLKRGRTNQDVCRPTQPQTLSSRPI